MTKPSPHLTVRCTKIAAVLYAAFYFIAIAPSELLAQNSMFIQSDLSGKYVRVTSAKWLQADMTLISVDADGRDRLFYFNKDNGFSVLRSLIDTKYVRAGVEQHSFLAAVSESIGGWQRFAIEEHENGTVSMRSAIQDDGSGGAAGKFVRAGVGQLSRLAASSTVPSGWSAFHIGTMNEANFTGDLDANGWCYWIDSASNSLVIYPRVYNHRLQHWRVPVQGDYWVSLASFNGSISNSVGKKHPLYGYPKLQMHASGGTYLKGVSVAYSPNWEYSFSGWGFDHPIDVKPSNNHDESDKFTRVKGSEFLGDSGSMKHKRCRTQPPDVGFW